MSKIPPSQLDEEDHPSEAGDSDNLQYVQNLIRRIKSSPNYVTPAEREKLQAERKRFFAENISPLRQLAQQTGANLSSNDLSDLLKPENLLYYRTLLPAIVDYFLRYDEFGWNHNLGKLLANREAGEIGARALVLGFEAKSDKWEIASYLESNPQPVVASDVIRFLQNTAYGRGRQRLCVVLAKTQDPRAFDVLSSVLNEPELIPHAIEGFGILKDRRAIPLIEPHLQDKQAWIRKLAATVIKRLEKTKSTAIQ